MANIYKKGGLSVYQGRDLRKENGKIKSPNSKKRKANYGRYPILTKISKGNEEIRYIFRTKGGNYKVKLKSALYVNVLNPETKEIKRVKILGVIKNPNDKNLDREKIITKNAILNTEIGKVLVTSRPGQDGIINGILIKE
ncbi:30S ribosomal protein S8e [Candidatus Nanobsidianus stetteri]|uniref:Small ribosomal subunit protein eS8 n=1 Tax=Nanobsidianus stetteri TaxID=1294122 RepID=A0A2T9WR21_NANST|nr:30S ribosomal protein S8e [Candidatus Nanobsidianus stetteri]PVU70456.1 30S ribosomal protein S8e [Candidatus Nanobsidianus stetteri]